MPKYMPKGVKSPKKKHTEPKRAKSQQDNRYSTELRPAGEQIHWNGRS